MSEKLKSRKLWVFISITIVILVNYIFSLKMPTDALISLVGIAASYILGQGYVDGKQQPIKELPVTDIVNSLSDIVQTELAKTKAGQALPLDEIMPLFKNMLAAEMSKVNILTIAPVVAPAPIPIVEPTIVPEVIPAVLGATTEPVSV